MKNTQLSPSAQVLKVSFGDVPLIEKGIPIPITNRGVPSKWLPLLLKLEVGDSFLVPHGGKVARLREIIKQRNLTIKIQAHKCGEQVRVWRVK